MTWPTSFSTRRSACCPACAWAWPPRRSAASTSPWNRAESRARLSGSRTLRSNDHSPQSGVFWAAVNGSGASFSNPLVLTYPSGANPVDKPRVQLTVTNLAQFSNPNFDDDNQLWTAFTGVLP